MTQELSTAARVLRIGESVLFVGLLIVGAARAALAGSGWPVLAAAVGVLVVFGVGLAVHRRISDAGRGLWVLLLLLGTVGLVLASRDFLWLAFPIWLLAAQTLPWPLALGLIAGSLAAVVGELRLTGDTSVSAVIGPLIGALVAFGLARGVVRFEREGAENRRLLAEVLTSRDALAAAQREAGVQAERTRLAHDIHDTLAQGFNSILLLARAASRDADPRSVHELVGRIEQAAAENLAESRRVVYALASEPQAGIGEHLRRLAAEAAAAMGAEASVRIDDDLPSLGSAVEVALVRSAQGALANVRRHSRARRIAVTLSVAGEEVLLDVVDDGIGFDPTQPAEPGPEGGYGLRALRERLAAQGGGLDVESEPGGGTAVSIRLPLTGGIAS